MILRAVLRTVLRTIAQSRAFRAPATLLGVLGLASLVLAPPAFAETPAEDLTRELRLVGPEEEPAAGATVRVRPVREPWEAAVADLAGAGMEWGRQALADLGLEPPEASEVRARTDGEGWVSLPMAEAGLQRIEALPRARDGWSTRRIFWAPGSEALAFPKRSLERIDGSSFQVLLPDGRPAAGAWALASWTSPTAVEEILALGRAVPRSFWTRLDDQGRGRLPRFEGLPLELAVFTAAGEALGWSALEGTARPGALRLAPPGRTAARVVDGDGAPVPYPLVRRVGQPSPWALGDRSGRIHLPEAGVTEGPFEVLGPGGRRLRVSLPAPAPEAEGEIRWRLEPPTLVTGTLRDADTGKPVAGALVAGASPEGTLYEVEDWGFTDGAGRFAWRVPDGTGGRRDRARAWITAAGYGDAQLRVDLPPPVGGLDLALEPRASLAGRIVDPAGQPLAGVRLSLTPARHGPLGFDMAREVEWAESDRHGDFRVAGLLPGEPYRLRVDAFRYRLWDRELPAFEPREERRGLEVALEASRVGVGQVLDEAGVPIAGARVIPIRSEHSALKYGLLQILKRDRPGGRGGDRASGLSDEAGRYELPDLEPGTVDLLVEAAGHAPTAVRGLEIPDGPDAAAGEVDLGVLYLEVESFVEGRVVDGSGAPVPGAGVVAFDATDDHLAFVMADFRSSEPDAVTDEAGRFRVGGLADGWTVDLVGRKEGWLPALAARVSVPPAEDLELEMQQGARLEGIVVDGEGRPVEGAMALVSVPLPGGSIASMNRPEQTTGKDGRFIVQGVPPGRVEMSVMARGYPTERVEGLEVAAGEVRTDLRVVIGEGSVVRGRVVDPDGRPVEGATVGLERGGSSGSSFSRTDPAGEFELRGVPEGPHDLRVLHGRFPEAIRELEVGPVPLELEIVLEAGLSISGRVLWEDTGRPVAGAVLMLSSSPTGDMAFPYAQASSLEDGSFLLDGLSPGTYQVLTDGPSADGQAFIGTRSEPVELDRSPVRGVELRVRRGAEIHGEILGLDHDGLVRVQVRAELQLSPRAPGQALQDPLVGRWSRGEVSFDGTYRLGGVTPGLWEVRAVQAGTGRQATARVEVGPSDREVRADLEFGEGSVVEGEVLLDGEPLQGLRVSLSSPVQVARFLGPAATTDHQGRFRFEGIEVGTWEVSVGFGGNHVARTVELPGDERIRFDLESVVITGRVTDGQSGAAVAGARVSLRELEADGGTPGGEAFRRSVREETDGSGRFELRTLGAESAELPVELQVEAEGYSLERRSVRLAPPPVGGGPIDLEIPLSPTTGATLRLVRQDGGRLGWVDVMGRLEGSQGPPASVGTVSADPRGLVRLASLPPGTHRLWVRSRGTARVEVAVTVPREGSEPLEVLLPPAATLVVEVPELEDLPGATLTLTDSAGRPWLAWGSYGLVPEVPLMGGRRQLGELPAGPWTVRVTSPDGRVWEDTVTLTPGEPRVVTPRLAGSETGGTP